MAKPEQTQPQRAGLPLPRTPRSQRRVGSAARPELRPLAPFYRELHEEQRRWFDREVATLQRLAHTERLKGDFIAAQRLERELDSFIAAAAALMGQERG